MKSDIEKLIVLMDNRQLLKFHIQDAETVTGETMGFLKTTLADRAYSDKQIEGYRESGLADENIPLSMAAEEEAEQESFTGTGGWLGAWLFGVLVVFLVNVAFGIKQLDTHLFLALPGLTFLPIILVLYILFLKEHRWFPKILMVIFGLMMVTELIMLIPEGSDYEAEYFGLASWGISSAVMSLLFILYFGFSKHVRRYFHR